MCVLLNSQCHDTDKESNRLLAHLLLLQRFVSLLDEDSAVFYVCRSSQPQNSGGQDLESLLAKVRSRLKFV